MNSTLKKYIDLFLGKLEDEVKAIVEAEFDALVDDLVAKAAAMIKGPYDDIVLAALKAEYKVKLKEFILKLADKIDGEEG